MPNVLDRLAALAALVLFAPLLLLVSVAIKLCDEGPVFYVAKRVGRYGAPFDMYKFRSMRVRADMEDGGPVVTAAEDARITPLGRILRQTKVDELPQLLNILLGDMAIIGPRPEDFGIVQEHYDGEMLDSLKVRPGLASPGSLYNYSHLENKLIGSDPTESYTRCFLRTKVLMDAYYADRKSFFYDIRLIYRTIRFIILKVLGSHSFPDPPELAFVRLRITKTDGDR